MLAGFGEAPCLFTSVLSTMVAGVLASLLAAESLVFSAPEGRPAAVLARASEASVPDALNASWR